ncbi:MAG: hypothetical protein ACRCXZ_07580, partial [Patescibacteria group bacterium]
MEKLEKIIKFYLEQEVEIVKNRIKKKYNLQKIYFYIGFEIMTYCDSVYLINNKICNFNKNYFLIQEISKYGSVLGDLAFECQNNLENHRKSLSNPPTHIKVTYDVKQDTYDFEYIYDKMLDEDKGDSFGTLFREWQYQLGKPRPEEIEIPEGYHLEIRSIKKEIK